MPSKPPRPLSPRYGIAEWFGLDVTTLSAEQRGHFWQVASGEAGLRAACPFGHQLYPSLSCSKAGGVCSIRKYRYDAGGNVVIDADPPVTVCPTRFLDQADLLRWAGEVLLGTEHPLLVKEVPFLSKLGKDATLAQTLESDTDETDADSGKKAGRIDWVLVDPDLGGPLKWCALETQAVYFSGRAMGSEFANWAQCPPDLLPFPTEVRRPDYRSSGPKRLAPQLQVKVPELLNWGIKTCVLVDRYFFSQMSHLPNMRGRDAADRLANSAVVWLIADYEASGRLMRGEVVYSRLEDSVRALNATQPISRTAFEQEVRDAVGDAGKRGSKVFSL